MTYGEQLQLREAIDSSSASFDPKAEETCENLLKTAFETDSNNIDALICLSSFRLSQQKPEEAKQAAIQAWTVWKDEEGIRSVHYHN